MELRTPYVEWSPKLTEAQKDSLRRIRKRVAEEHTKDEWGYDPVDIDQFRFYVNAMNKQIMGLLEVFENGKEDGD